jgi:hypothetical protein
MVGSPLKPVTSMLTSEFTLKVWASVGAATAKLLAMPSASRRARMEVSSAVVFPDPHYTRGNRRVTRADT